MALIVTNRTFTDDQNRTLSFPYFSGYDRVKASYNVRVDFSLEITVVNSIQKIGNALILQSGQSWESFGFFAGANISGSYENGSSHNIPNGATVDFIDGNIMYVNANLGGSDGIYTGGVIRCDEVAEQLEFQFNLIENTAPNGTPNSLIDGEQIRFTANVSSLLVLGSTAMTRLGNHSGGSQVTARVERQIDVNGLREYKIEISFNPWTVKLPELYDIANCVKPWVRFSAFPELANPSVFISTINVPTDANTGLIEEVGNGGTGSYSIQYVELSNGVDTVENIDYAIPTEFEIRVNGVFNANSKFNLFAFFDSTDDSDYKNLPTDFDQNLFVIKNNSVLGVGSFADIPSASRPDSAEILISELEIAQFTTYAIITGKFVPNGGFTSILNSKDSTNRRFKFWVRCENPTLTGNEIRPMWLQAYDDELVKISVPLGEYKDLNIRLRSHDNDYPNTFFIEDDMASDFTIQLPKNDNSFKDIKVSVIVRNTVTNEYFKLEEFTYNIGNLPTLIDGTKPIDFTINRGFNLSPTNDKKTVIFERYPILDTVSLYGVVVNYSFLNRWEYWLEQLGTDISFYSNSTKKWVDYITGDWTLNVACELHKEDEFYFNFKKVNTKDYDDWSGVTNVSFELEDGTAVNNPIIDGITKVKFTFSNTSNFDDSAKWGRVTVRSFEQGNDWDLSTVFPWGNVNANPLRPLSGESGLKLTYSADELYLECLFDATKLSDPTKVTFTGRFYSQGDLLVENRHKFDIETVRIPKPDEADDRGTKGCCDCDFDVYADDLDERSYRNMVTSRWMLGETVNFVLNKNGVNTGFIPTAQTFPNDSGAKFCTIPWRDVLLYSGAGCYELIGTSQVSGVTVTKKLGVFKLRKFDWEWLQNRVMIRSVFNDANLRERINFTNANVMDSLLLKGDIEEFQPNTEINNLVRSNFVVDKVKRENRTTWTVNVDYASFCELKWLENQHLLGENELYVSDLRRQAFDRTILDMPVSLPETANNTPLYNSLHAKTTFKVQEKIVNSVTKYGFVDKSGAINLGDIILPNLLVSVDVFVNDIEVVSDATNNVNLNLIDQNGNDVPFIQSGFNLEVNNLPCEDATVTNSNDTYTETVASGGVLVLPDTNYIFTVDGVVQPTITLPTLEDTTININWI